MLASIMDSAEVWQLIVVGVVALLGLGFRALAKQSWAKDLEQKLFTSVEVAAQRAKDKYLDAITASRQPDSDGGVTVTPGELSHARQIAYEFFLRDGAADVVNYGVKRGEDFVKGLIGKQLGWQVAVKDAPPTP